ncbi:hypothetical protein [Chryseobacterium limigenitum]|uniref:hypothetical protein n=1 Tax=Chryseobacterium limigenitum TaxID=1612149 RepID=UPI0033931293
MKSIKFSLSALFLGTVLSYGQVGINTTSPQSTLDVSGDFTNREATVATSANIATIPATHSQIQVTGTATDTVILTAPVLPTNNGKRLIIYNNTAGGFPATMSGIIIPNGRAVEFVSSTGGWKSTDGGLNSSAGANTDWKLGGNAGTTAGTNYLGTSDSNALRFKTNNTDALTIDTSQRVGIGTTAPGYNLTAIGTVAFPTVASTVVAAPYEGLGINITTGQIGTLPSSQPIFIQYSASDQSVGTGPTLNMTNTTNTIRLPVTTSPATTLLNTIGVVQGTDGPGVTLDGVFNSGAIMDWFQVPTTGYYRIEINGTFGCTTGSGAAANSLSNTAALHLKLYKAPSSGTSYTSVDEIRGLMMTMATNLNYPLVPTPLIVQLTANMRIAIRAYSAFPSTGNSICGFNVPAGAQPYSSRITITKL